MNSARCYPRHIRAVHKAVAIVTTLFSLSVVSLTPLAASAASPDPAHSTVVVRVGDHRGFGRIVFDLPSGASFETVTEGSRMLVVFTGVERLELPFAKPRNVLALKAEGATATLSLVAGAKPHALRLDDRLIIDVLDGSPASMSGTDVSASTPANGPAPLPGNTVSGTETPTRFQDNSSRGSSKIMAVSSPKVLRPSEDTKATVLSANKVRSQLTTLGIKTEVTSPPAIGPKPSPPILGKGKELDGGSDGAATAAVPTGIASPDLAIQQAPSAPIERAHVPELSPILPQPPLPKPKPTALLPADATVGLAAFRREELAVIVLDRKLTLPVPAAFPDAVIVPGAVSTVLYFPLCASCELHVLRVATGWSLEVAAEGSLPDMAIAASPAGVAFSLSKPGRTVTIIDPMSGGTLLVGTSLADGPHTGIDLSRRSAEYVILPTWLGVAVEPLSDREDLQPQQDGFVLRGAKPATAIMPVVSAGRFDLPDEAVPGLLNRMRIQLASAAAAPPRGRTAARLAAAQAMLALGLGVETQALLQRAAIDDPQAAADVQLPALQAMAAVLAGRLDEAEALDDPRLQDGNEVLLWRGLRDRRRGQTTAAALALPDHLALVRHYPEPLRLLIWPDLAEAAVEAGTPLSKEETTPFAAALQLEHSFKVDEALHAWRALADGPDRRDNVRATRRSIELQLAAGRINSGEAGDRLETLTTTWRGDSHEFTLRVRAAELRAAGGDWRASLNLLRATDPLFPNQYEEIRRRKTAVFETMLSAEGAGLSPVDLVLLASDFADCVPDDAAGTKLAALLADKLTMLDLSARAIPVLQGLVRSSVAGAARAEFGSRLAQLLLEGGDPDAAIAALQASATPGVVTGTRQKRELLFARAEAARGNLAASVEKLERLGTAEADDLRATLLEKAGDWVGSLQALQDLAAKVLPPGGNLDVLGQAVVIREAAAAAQASDLATLQTLRRQLPRMSDAQANVLQTLTQPPVLSFNDLPRSSLELAQARNIPLSSQVLVRR